MVATAADLEGLLPHEFPGLGAGIEEFVLGRREAMAGREGWGRDDGGQGRMRGRVVSRAGSGAGRTRHDEMLQCDADMTLRQVRGAGGGGGWIVWFGCAWRNG